MPGAAQIVQSFYLLASCVTVIKLLKTGLYRRYPVFTWYFGFSVIASLLPLLVNTYSQLYLKLFVCTMPVFWVFYILVVRELYGLILEKHKGLYTLGRWLMYFSVAVAVTLSIVSLLPKIKPAAPQASIVMGYIVAIERGVDLSLVLFILLMLMFLTMYPVPLSRNVLVHATVYSVFFLNGTMVMLIRVFFGLRLEGEVNVVITAVSTACTLAWLFLLSPGGEQVRVNLPWLTPGHERRLLAHLDTLDATLLKASKLGPYTLTD